MHSAAWIQHLFVLMLVVVVPVAEARFDRRLKQFTSSKRRIAWYRINSIVLCALAGVAIALAYPVDIFTTADAPTVAAWLGAHRVVLFGTTALAVAYTSLTLVQGIKAATSRALRLKMASAMQSLRFALPVTTRERRWWILVSLCAGVCKEILFRGYLTHYLSGAFGSAIALGTVGAWLAASLCFGLAHAYQGIAGIVRTAVGGSILGLIALLSGGLALPIALHILFDVQMLWMYRPMADEPHAAAQLVDGCDPSALEIVQRRMPANPARSNPRG